MRRFDNALHEFEEACIRAVRWKEFPGAAYRSRLDQAFAGVKAAYENACRVDDEELGRR